jgi:predicted dipeptidase
MLAIVLVPHVALAQTIGKEAMDLIIDRYQSADLPPNFKAFAKAEAAENAVVREAVNVYVQGQTLEGEDLVNVGRLLGIYNRLQNADNIVDSLASLIAVPTFRNPDISPHENEAIIEIGGLIATMATDFGLQYRNVDNRIFEVKLPGAGGDEFGILTHADVVPVNAQEWVLEGTAIDPFELTVVDGKMYGRGAIDDKGPIVASLYAMKVVQESGIPIERGIRLMIETTEETGGEGMEYYRDKNELPEYNIVLDSRYPAVVAEKGAGYLRAYFPETGTGGGTAITGLVGAPAPNAVPAEASATIKTDDGKVLVDRLNAAKASYIDALKDDGKFDIEVNSDGDDNEVHVVVKGASAHGSRPEEGVNPVSRLTGFLLGSGVEFADNDHRRAAQYVNDVFGTGFLGEKLGIGYSDDFMGPLTVVPVYFNVSEGKLEVAANMRIPRGKTAAQVQAMVAEKLEKYNQDKGWGAKFKHTQGDWMARDPKGEWLAVLLEVFGNTTGLEAKPIPTAGSTTAKYMPNAINFGPSMPGFKYTAHGALENHLAEHMYNDMRMFTEMMLRIGNLQSME